MTPRFPFERVGIVGLGLMGGSHARAMSVLDDRPHIVAFNRNREQAERALADGVIDVVAGSAEEAVEGQDLVIYATPLDVAREMMRRHSAVWGTATVTDVAGLKQPMMQEARETGCGSQFVGSHPLDGPRWIFLRSGKHSITIRQIAGLIARRIVCRIRERQAVRPGQRLGLIRFRNQALLWTVTIMGVLVLGSLTVLLLWKTAKANDPGSPAD